MFCLQCLIFFAPAPCLGLCILIDKATHTLRVQASKDLKFPVSLGIDPVSPKRHRGDGATPEGLYYITYMKKKSRFYKFIGISYPNIIDAWLGKRAGIIGIRDQQRIIQAISRRTTPPQDTPLGGEIGIHGGGVRRDTQGVAGIDWTQGCIAMEDRDIDRLFPLCKPGMPVIIYNSKAAFFDMMRPFAYPVDLCDKGQEHVSRLGFITSFGPSLLTLKESDDFNRAIRITVYGRGTDHPPTCEIIDRNGDGKTDFRDKIIGKLDGISAQKTYGVMKKEMVRALSKGKIKGWRLRNGRLK